MNLADYYAGKLGKSVAEITAAAAFMIGADGPVALRWDADRLGPQPSAEDLVAALALPEPTQTIAGLAETLVQAATAACSAITHQVVPDDTHQTAYANAATIVWGGGGQAPSSDPAKSVFAAQAAALGLTVAQFVAVVQSVSLVSLELATALSTLRGAAAGATNAGDLATALTAFEASIAAVVQSLQGAGLTVAITPPAAITIPGINA